MRGKSFSTQNTTTFSCPAKQKKKKKVFLGKVAHDTGACNISEYNKSNVHPEWGSPGIVVYQTTWANGDHHVWCGNVMEACALGVFEVAIREPYLGDDSVAKRQGTTKTMVKPGVRPTLAKENV